jgi:nucleotide-binding universal stress UspA family protein
VADTTQDGPQTFGERGGAAGNPPDAPGGAAGSPTDPRRRLPGQVREHVGDLAGAVVLGTDGSGSARAALAFAAQEARLRGVPLVVLRAWSLTTAPRPSGSERGVVPPMTAFEQAVADEVSAEVAAALGSQDDLPVRPLPVHASAADSLIDATRTAALVVVGHAHRGRVGKLLGSVSDHVLRHARGPVAVVP